MGSILSRIFVCHRLVFGRRVADATCTPRCENKGNEQDSGPMTNDIIRGITDLHSKAELDQVVRHCELLQAEYDQASTKSPGCFEYLYQEYYNKNCDYLQQQLRVEFYMRFEEKRHKKLGEVLLYYLLRDEEVQPVIQTLVQRLCEPLYDHARSEHNWYELICEKLFNENIFSQFYECLDESRNRRNDQGLERLLYKRPQLLLNKNTYLLMHRLIERLPLTVLHRILMATKDENGQTCLFYTSHGYKPYALLYVDDFESLFDLLSMRNADGQTAVHINARSIADLLADTYKPRHRQKFIELLSIRDDLDQTALHVADDRVSEVLSALVSRIENNEYVTYAACDTSVIIAYNTKNRPEAESEALAIYDACTATYSSFKITLEANKSKEDLLDIIKRTAKRKTSSHLSTALIVILASHGSIGKIVDGNGEPIPLSSIEEAMSSKVLNGRPKMLITQCCQTGKASVRTPAYYPTRDHFISVMSSVPGQPSKRGVFLKKLADQVTRSTINTNIFKLVGQVAANMELEGHEQTPIITSTLKATFCPTDDWVTKK